MKLPGFMNNTQSDLPASLRCYWVQSGRFLAGEYPSSRYFENKTHQILDSLLTLGIDTFIDLTQPGELPPYEKTLYETAGWLEKSPLYQRFSIPDFNTPSLDEMRTILAFIDQRLADGHNLYIHCYAGIGRTGTTVGCFLAERCGSGETALKQLAELRRQIPGTLQRSPESDAQWNLVKHWKKAG
jgi:protein tyrosine/serine phosphatase